MADPPFNINVTITGDVSGSPGTNQIYVRDQGNAGTGLYSPLYLRSQYGGAGATGNRFNFLSYWSLDQTPDPSDTSIQDYTAGTFQAYVNAPTKLGLTGGSNYSGYAGELWGTDFNVWVGTDARHLGRIVGWELGAAIYSPGDAADRFGGVMYAAGDVKGTIDDAGLLIAGTAGGSPGSRWGTAIQFGGVRNYGPTDTNGTLIGAKPRTQGGTTGNVQAMFGVDFNAVDFNSAGSAFRSPGFNVYYDGSVRVQGLRVKPGTNDVPQDLGELTWSVVSDTQIRISVRGKDGKVRNAYFPLR